MSAVENFESLGFFPRQAAIRGRHHGELAVQTVCCLNERRKAVAPRNESDVRPASPPTPEDRRWAAVRILLGTAQIVGATVSAYLLFQTGTNKWSLSAVAVTGLLFAMSKLLF